MDPGGPPQAEQAVATPAFMFSQAAHRQGGRVGATEADAESVIRSRPVLHVRQAASFGPFDAPHPLQVHSDKSSASSRWCHAIAFPTSR